MNGHLFTKLTGCHCRLIMIQNKIVNERCWGFKLCCSDLITVYKWAVFSEKLNLCSANQWTGFYMITASVLKRLSNQKMIFHVHSQVIFYRMCPNLVKYAKFYVNPRGRVEETWRKGRRADKNHSPFSIF